MTRSRSPLLIGAALVIALIVIALIAGDQESSTSGPSLSPTSTASDGTRGLILLLRELGANVRVGDRLPDASTHVALLLQDGLDDRGTKDLESWVRAGNTLVDADPKSLISALPSRSRGGPSSQLLPRRTCTMPELGDVSEIRAYDPWSRQVSGTATSCFGTEHDAFVVREPLGSGTIVSVGNASVFTNALLDEADNSVLAARLLLPGGGGPVAVLDPNPAGSGHTTLGDLIADRVFQAILQLGVAFVIYALWRARRVGRPVVETQPVAIAGSQFVRAVGGLQRRSRATDKAATTLRTDTRRLITERYAIPVGTDGERLAEITSSRTGIDRTTVAAALSEAPVVDEAALVNLARQLDTIREEVLDGRTG